ncbi:hypothetical protein G6F24_016060 [Rhizopus arrhizus]|nr:hypothetical protein G6F24_016060 [Rhizopus arrhizus]
MARPCPRSLAHSVSIPSGQNQPPQARPRIGMEISTNGHQTPQKANCATIVRLLKTDAVLSGKGRIAGTIKRNAYNATMPHCSLRNSGAWSRRKSAIREVTLPSTAAMVKPSLFSPASRRNQDALRAAAGARAGLLPTQRSSAQTTIQ